MHITIFHTIILGIVEGLTEFIPVSSTAHLLIVEKLLHVSPGIFVALFTVVIQIGAILAVVALFGIKRFFKKDMPWKLLIAFIPTAIAGIILFPLITRLLEGSLGIIALMLLIGGILLLLVEKKEEAVSGTKPITINNAFWIGCYQAIAIIPGVSRSGAVLIGGLASKYKRSELVDFSFMLAVPTIAAATIYDLWKARRTFAVLPHGSLGILFIGALISFIIAYLTAAFFIRSMKKNVRGYGWYRIVLAVILLVVILA